MSKSKTTAAPTLRYERVSVDSLTEDPANVRLHPERNLDAIKASLRRFGQQKPLVADGKGVVVAGNGTLRAARALGWTEVDVVRTELEGADAVAFAIADNRTAELAEWDTDALVRVLGALKGEGDDIESTGFSEGEVSIMLAPEATCEQQGWGGMPERDESGELIPYRQIVMNFACAEDVADFEKLIGQSFTDRTRSAWHPEHKREAKLPLAFVPKDQVK